MVGTRWAVCILVLFFPGLVAAQTAPDWEAAKKAILADYAKQQPGDKVIEITGPEKRDAIILAVRYYGRVLIERADKTRERQGVWIEYRLVGDRWELQTVKVYESTALADLKRRKGGKRRRLMAAWPGPRRTAKDSTSRTSPSKGNRVSSSKRSRIATLPSAGTFTRSRSKRWATGNSASARTARPT